MELAGGDGFGSVEGFEMVIELLIGELDFGRGSDEEVEMVIEDGVGEDGDLEELGQFVEALGEEGFIGGFEEALTGDGSGHAVEDRGCGLLDVAWRTHG